MPEYTKYLHGSQSLIAQIRKYFLEQPNLAKPYKEIGIVDTPSLSLVQSKQYTIKTDKRYNQVWSGGKNWYLYKTKTAQFYDPDFETFHEQISGLVQQYISSFIIKYAGIYCLKAGGYLEPHCDKYIRHSIYIPFYLPKGCMIGWKDCGPVNLIEKMVYAFDTTTEHALINDSMEDRYVYIVEPLNQAHVRDFIYR